MTGTVKTLRAEKGFGFISDSAGKEFFFHQSAIYGEGIDKLREGDTVEFEIGAAGPKGSTELRIAAFASSYPSNCQVLM